MKLIALLRPIFLTITIAGVFAVLLLGCSRSRPRQSAAVEQGHELYLSNCSPCHDTNNVVLRKRPPRLAGLFQHSTLPSGAPATNYQVGGTILQGRGIMPAFEGRLSEQQINDIIAFLHTQ